MSKTTVREGVTTDSTTREALTPHVPWAAVVYWPFCW